MRRIHYFKPATGPVRFILRDDDYSAHGVAETSPVPDGAAVGWYDENGLVVEGDIDDDEDRA